jgi:hypothetical protein
LGADLDIAAVGQGDVLADADDHAIGLSDQRDLATDRIPVGRRVLDRACDRLHPCFDVPIQAIWPSPRTGRWSRRVEDHR